MSRCAGDVMMSQWEKTPMRISPASPAMIRTPRMHPAQLQVVTPQFRPFFMKYPPRPRMVTPIRGLHFAADQIVMPLPLQLQMIRVLFMVHSMRVYTAWLVTMPAECRQCLHWTKAHGGFGRKGKTENWSPSFRTTLSAKWIVQDATLK